MLQFIASITKGLEEADVYSAWASTKNVDRDNEVILPAAFRGSLQAYLKRNPVIYYDHAWASFGPPSDSTLPVGKAVGGRVDAEKGLLISWKFHELEFAQKIKYLVDAGVLNTVSVGFIPKDVVWDPIKIAEQLQRAGIELPETPRRLYKEVELLELSVVGIPSNREAEIIRGLEGKMGEQELAKAKSYIHELATAGPEPEKRGTGGETPEEPGRRFRLGAGKLAKNLKKIGGT